MWRNLIIPGLLLTLSGITGCEGCNESKKDSCVPGEIGCECIDGTTCNDGLVCENNICIGESMVGLSVSDADARSCEVLLEETGDATKITGLTLNSSVKASYVRHDPNVAISFISLSDSAVTDGAVSIRATAYNSADDMQVVKTNCFDRDGEPLSGVNVEIIH